MKKLLLISLISISSLVSVFLLIKNRDYKDIIYTNRLKDINEIPLDSISVKKINDNLDYIISSCTFYDISPKAVIGIIIAECSLNNSPANYFEQLYVKKHFLNKDVEYLENLANATIKEKAKRKLKGESELDFEYRLRNGLIWTIGICQISIINAWSLEPQLSIHEKRKQRNIKETIESLLIEEENIKYCVFELKRIVDIYESNTGKDISNDYLTLSTLYNSGLVDRYKNDNIPKLNRFSNYIARHHDLINELANTTHNTLYK
nr:hypothetical protein [uncultured Draconibacterium sp.]